MKLAFIQEIISTSDASIVAASLSAPDEYVLLLSSGNVVRQKAGETAAKHLFSVESSMGYQDGGFDIAAPSTIYTMDDIVVVVNDYKRHGYVHYPGKYTGLHLWREDYHASISRFPVALFRDQLNVPYIVYAVAWNHLQIMNLDTRQVVTAAKSLIKEFAEESHIEFYKTVEEANKLPWPSAYDYFFGKLYMSPNNSRFLSAGWVWGSSDLYNVYEVADFISNPRIRDKRVNYWEHNNRGVCWIDNATVAVTYHPYSDDEEGAAKDDPWEIHFYNVDSDADEPARKIKIPGPDILQANMHYLKHLDAILLFGGNAGVVLVSTDGRLLFSDANLKINGYAEASDLLYVTDDKSVSTYRIS
ncbi:hypothetical protein ACTJJ0_27280 [Chitinophaga sp. 22321]|uniref:Uncharacterized protein n=1 Tax=Chitinophaga hostae TaxID=2831022 RepID=A0ABS5J6X2_9BACT|nr:hypothetical protein [Chitinophaga hostae]MBS0030816.1 hypothetical protein [Chitinophaga hostae]